MFYGSILWLCYTKICLWHRLLYKVSRQITTYHVVQILHKIYFALIYLAACWEKSYIARDRGGGQVVSVLALNSANRSSNPAEAYSFFCKICVWKEKTKKRSGLAHFWKKFYSVDPLRTSRVLFSGIPCQNTGSSRSSRAGRRKCWPCRWRRRQRSSRHLRAHLKCFKIFLLMYKLSKSCLNGTIL